MKVLSEATFATLAGDGAYQRGLAYYNEGRVGDLSIEGSRISAEVSGTQVYQVALHHTARIFEGSCSCPASDGFEFCKHCVAVSLSYYYQTQTNQELGDADTSQLVLNYLNTLTKPQLANELHALLRNHSDAMEQWQLKAAIASGAFGATDIRKQITKALPYKASGLWRHREVSEYFEHASQALTALTEPLTKLAPDAIEKLLTYALQRLEKSLQTIDDTGGYRQPVEQLLTEWFKRIISSKQWTIEEKASSIAAIILDSDHAFERLDLPDSIVGVVPDACLDQVYHKVATEWNSLSPTKDKYSPDHAYYRKLEQILLNQARAKGDLDREFEILGKGAVGVDRSLELVHRAIATGRVKEARDWLHVAGHFEEPSTRELYEIETAQIDVWLAQGRYQQALDAQWLRFEEQEDPDILQSAIATANHLDKGDQVLEQGIAHLTKQLRHRDTSHRNRQRAEALVRVYLANERVHDAIKLARQVPFSNATLSSIISAANKVNRPAIPLIVELAQRLIEADKNRNYQQGIAFLSAQHKHMGPKHNSEFQRALEQLMNKSNNIRRPNFAKAMRKNFEFLQQ